MRGRLRRAVSENFGLKLVSFILAVTLFILVHGERDAIVAAQIPVSYTNPDDREVMTELVDKVRVRIKGPWTRIKRFDEDQVEPIIVDLDQVGDGDFYFEEDMIHLPPGLKILSINPPTLRLEFQPKVEKDVPVKVAIAGTPARGYTVDRAVARPQTVRVRGAQRAVEATSSLETRKVSVSRRPGSTGGPTRRRSRSCCAARATPSSRSRPSG